MDLPILDLPMIGPFAGVVVVPVLVTALKRLGMSSQWAPIANVVLSTVWFAVAGALVQNPEWQLWGTAVVNILLTVLAGWGLYEGQLWAGRLAKE